NSDSQFYFSKCIINCFVMYYIFENKNKKIGLHFFSDNPLYDDTNFLLKLYDIETAAKLISKQLEYGKENNAVYSYYDTCDALCYMKILYEENNLSADILKKIGNEGFTDYNHNLLSEIYEAPQPLQFVNLKITYSEEEKNLEWKNIGYKFCLPEDTRRLVDIGSKMNICVGHLYRDKAVNKDCTIVYVILDNEYELCIELSKQTDHFHLKQVSAFNNIQPHGNALSIFKKWCRTKNIYWK
ncbi:MAG: PcfJ domain-containing protein, partial [Treponema sp.]|nr:PcfJ domain-containing protein [Treponema sp.]